MKDPALAIRSAYATLLQGAVLHEAVPVPVFDGNAPNDRPDHYIILGEQTCLQRGTKTSFVMNCSIVVIAVTRFMLPDPGNTMEADMIANQITQIINPDPVTQIDLAPEFYCLVTNVEGSNSSRSEDSTYRYVEKAIRFSHIVEQLNI